MIRNGDLMVGPPTLRGLGGIDCLSPMGLFFVYLWDFLLVTPYIRGRRGNGTFVNYNDMSIDLVAGSVVSYNDIQEEVKGNA